MSEKEQHILAMLDSIVSLAVSIGHNESSWNIALRNQAILDTRTLSQERKALMEYILKEDSK